MLAGGADGVLEVARDGAGPGRDRDLEPRRITRGALGERNANRCGMARRRDGRRRDRRHRRLTGSCTRASSRTGSSSRISAASRRSAKRRSTASRSCRSRSATRMRSSLGDPSRIADLGPLLETHARFPERTNVQVARVEAPGEVTARVWERGVGETLVLGDERGCGRRGHAWGGRRARPLPGRRSPRPARGRACDALRHRGAPLLTYARASSTRRPSGSRRYADRPHG